MENDLTNASAIEIANFYSGSGKLLRANMVISADGHFVDAHGSSRGLSSPLDLKVLLTLRAISDAVLVGANTVRAEDYRPPVLAGDFALLNKKPGRLIVLTNTLDFDTSSRLFSTPDNPPIFITAESQNASWLENKLKLDTLAEVIVLPAPLNLPLVVELLEQRGFTKIVCEGGPQLLGELVELNLIDELDITFSPVSVGVPATKTNVHKAIETWPNRVTAKLGSHQVARIKR